MRATGMNRKQRRAQQKINRIVGSAAQSDRALATPASEFAALTKEAFEHHQTGQLTQAIALYERILASWPNCPEIHYNLGIAFVGINKLTGAVASYRKAIRLKPDYGDAYNNLGNALRDLGQLDQAEETLRRAVSLRPGCPEYHSNLGLVLKLQNRREEAEAEYRRAIALKPDFVAAHVHLGDALADLGRLNEAEKSLRCAIALNPRAAGAYLSLGNTLYQLGRTTAAEVAYRCAIAANPNFAEAYSNLGNLLIDFDRLDEAELALRHATVLKPHLAGVFSNLSNVLREKGKPLQAEEACRHAIVLQPDYPHAHCGLGNALRDQQRHSEAERAYRHAITLKPDFADAYNNLGTALKEIGRLEEARRAIEYAIQLLPRNTRQYLNLGDLRSFVAGEPHIAAMEDLARNAPSISIRQQIELHFALGKAYEDIGRYDDAFQQLALGNALKRQQIDYDEGQALAIFKKIEAVFTPELIRKFRDVGDPSPIPVFIVGMPRSGSTLVEQILASHPKIHPAGELPTLDDAVAGLVRAADVATLPEAMLKLSNPHLRDLGQRYSAQIRQIAPSAIRITDKMPSNFLFIGLIHLALPNARIIHVLRDPVDTCMSCFSKLFAAGQYHTYDLAELGRFYRQYSALMQHWHNVLPQDRILEVRYERIVADLEGQARRIIGHCGLLWDTSCLAFHKTERPVLTASASQVRQPLYRTAIGRSLAYGRRLQPLYEALGLDPLKPDADVLHAQQA
jgi:tetratricopeptide (TPR) repeat protein